MHPDAVYIQGDIQFPPVDFSLFEIVHSSGVLTHTNNTELSFCCIERCVKPGGKLSIWIYHPRKDFIHNIFNRFRMLTSKLPAKLQYWLLYLTVFPVSFLIKRIKGNRQNRREMMIAILDWFTPEFRSEHQHDEAESWFHKRDYKSVAVTTSSLFGFSIIGIKETEGEK
jgi:ubiquinone/menaquinone biosynthesis C-methylase UbiE